ncbi:MAG: GNAT family N-acetyltransferase [Gemmatimonadota bacterium]|nr:GNAT family N-acetyltransferase [Gemmatimonadota bacterium]
MRSRAGRMSVSIETERFLLRELAESDATTRYLNWFRDSETRNYIASASRTKEIGDLRRYIRDRRDRRDVLFLGIFDKMSGTHIGNVKYEPVDEYKGYAVMGMLIGDNAYRGKGVALEVLLASGEWLKSHRDLKEIVLGVRRDNSGAIRAYEKVGYRVAVTPHLPPAAEDSLTMVWSL